MAASIDTQLENAMARRDQREYDLLDAIRKNGYQSPASEPQRKALGRAQERVDALLERKWAEEAMAS